MSLARGQDVLFDAPGVQRIALAEIDVLSPQASQARLKRPGQVLAAEPVVFGPGPIDLASMIPRLSRSSVGA
jgi:hypothetical protein